MSLRILAIGIEAEHDAIEHAPFDAATPLDDYDVVIVDPRVVTALWAGVGPAATDTRADNRLGRHLLELVRRRRREISKLFASGGTLICFLRPVGAPVRVRQRRADGSSATTVLHAYSWLPPEASVAQLVIAAGSGAKLLAADEQHLAWQLIRAQGERARFEAYVANDQLEPAWHVIATNELGHPVAFEALVGTGRLVLLPPIAAADAAERGALLADVLAPPPELPDTPPPDWLKDCLLPGQAEVNERLPKLAADVDRLEAELEELRAQHDELSRLNRLLYARHPAELGVAATTALRRLGFDVAVVAGQTDALDIACPEGKARVLLATAEGTIDSDPYWRVTELIEAEDAPDKGIIVGNAHCTKPPGQRGGPFSDLLRRGAHHKELALVNTIGLNAAVAKVIECPDDEELAQKLREAMLGAAGPCALARIIESDAGAD